MRLPENLRTLAFPTPEERWAAGSAEFDENGTPYFDLSIVSATKPEVEDFYEKRHPLDRKPVKIGKVMTRQFVTNDGIDRVSRLWLPDHFDGTLTGQSGTPFTGSIDGYPSERSRLMASRVGMPNIQHDAEHSGRRYKGVLDIIRLACTLQQSQTMSLAKSGQAEMLMTQAWVKDFDISPDIAAFGDSWDGINTLALPAYGEMYGTPVRYIDPKALVLHDAIEPTLEGILKVAKWIRTEVLGGAAVIAALIAEGDLSVVNGTIPLGKPNFWVSSFAGAAPALLGGEGGRFTEWLPKDMIGYANLFVNDLLCETEVWDADLARFPGIGVNHVPGGIHAHLLSRTSVSKQRGRFHRLHNENLEHGTAYEKFDADRIHGSYIGLSEAA